MGGIAQAFVTWKFPKQRPRSSDEDSQMSTSRVGETFDERPMTELMLLIGKDFVHFFWPRCGPRGPLISLQQRNAGGKKGYHV